MGKRTLPKISSAEGRVGTLSFSSPSSPDSPPSSVQQELSHLFSPDKSIGKRLEGNDEPPVGQNE